jgi:queuine tRNA-ribosyltransferase
MFRSRYTDGDARVANLRTNHGRIETPLFLPVATKAAAKHLSTYELKDLGTTALITNSFLLSLRPGVETIQKAGGLHKFMNWKDTIFTDSGGFQFLHEPFFERTTHQGGYFKSPFDGKTHFLSPDDSVKIQEGLGSDVMMCLDEMPLYGQTRQRVAAATRRTHTWARRCLEARTSKGLLFGIVQGGTYPDLRKKSAEFISKLDFDGISIGGLAVGEKKEEMLAMLDASLPVVPKNSPRYMMGVGSPIDIIECVSRGIDIFDSAFPTRNARHGTLFTMNSYLKITNREFREDTKPAEKDCDCPLCINYSRAYLHHLLRINEALGMRLASLHNIRFMNRLIEEIKTAIRESRLEKLKKEIFSYLARK